ncbi:MAG: YqgE/AlgH family protein [Pseudomonadota bacterium]|nr:YqgE/AlgH family protein [Pseudomonadota bacterium]
MPNRERRLYLSRQSIPAIMYVLFGGLMMATPYLVEHNGYNESVMVAREGLPAPFDQALVLIGGHTVGGATGIMLNKPLSAQDHDKLSAFLRDSGLTVSYGGPIAVSEKVFVLEERKETPDDKNPDFDLKEWDIAIRDNPDLINAIRKSDKNNEHHYRIFTGYAAWRPFQLEIEVMLKQAWRPVTTTHDLVFQTDPASHWDAVNRREQDKLRKANPPDQS